MDINAEKCLTTGGRIAFGYKVGKDKKFVIDEDKAPFLIKIYEMYADGKTIVEIVEYLNSLQIKTSSGSNFNRNSLNSILKNKRYIGIYTYNGKEIPDGLPRIISDELFERVQERMKLNKKAPARGRATEEYLLTTKLFCGLCKDAMFGYSGKSHTGAVHRYYRCKTEWKKECEKKFVRKHLIEDIVVLKCRELLTSENIDLIARKAISVIEQDSDNSNLKHYNKLLKENERKQQNLTQAVMECAIIRVSFPLIISV